MKGLSVPPFLDCWHRVPVRCPGRSFPLKCRQSVNPNLSEQAVLEMLIQHLLTERIFRRVFNNPDFTRRNAIAHEIENVIDALTSQSFNREDFTKSLDRFYVAIERTAATIDDFSHKQHFLNTVYEQFFQGYSVKVADTHGIVYTPQPIVTFMVKSVEDILQKEFGRSLSDRDVHIIDPFVGTGNFIVHVMQEIRKTALPYKYAHELHCNEVMLLPYYIASVNIEHAYFEATGGYQPFEGICLVDTFELVAEDKPYLPYFTTENTARVEKQKRTPMFVIIGNPPYNALQANENDNNKNRKYPVMDKRVAETYAKNSQATNKNALSDPYVKAIRWASDRIGDEGIVAFVTNNSFIDGIAFDGMRQHLAKDFDAIYVLDLSGNVRKNPKLSGTTHNVFGIQVGVSINIFIRKSQDTKNAAQIYYARVDEFWRKEEKYRYLDEKQHRGNIDWQSIQPDKKNRWLTEGLHDEFETFLPMGDKAEKVAQTGTQTLFQIFSNGVKTNRDTWAYNFNRDALIGNIKRTIATYNEQVLKWQHRTDRDASVDDFVLYDNSKISWSEGFKQSLNSGRLAEFSEEKVRRSMYRPFIQSNLFFARMLVERVYVFPSIFPTPATEAENRVICVPGPGGRTTPWCLCANRIPNLSLISIDAGQCFPFYTYNEDGTNLRENITDWSLAHFRAHYQDETIGKWDIFHYVYAVLHHPDYRERFQANLKRELPRIPFAPDFWAFASAGERLAEIHVHYEDQPQYPLKMVETPDQRLDWRVEKMRLSKDKTQLRYNDFLALDGIPSEVFDYRLGNRSALDWVIDQYQAKTDKRSGIVNDPNRQDDPEYIVRLIGQVISVSLETVKIVKAMPDLGLPSEG
jgi:predicted helicase